MWGTGHIGDAREIPRRQRMRAAAVVYDLVGHPEELARSFVSVRQGDPKSPIGNETRHIGDTDQVGQFRSDPINKDSGCWALASKSGSVTKIHDWHLPGFEGVLGQPAPLGSERMSPVAR